MAESGYNCLICDAFFLDDADADAHIVAHPSHRYSEAWGDHAVATVHPASVSVIAWAREALLARGVSEANVLANLDTEVYSDVSEIPTGDPDLEQYALIGGEIPQIAYSRQGQDIWTGTDWPFSPPPSPLGSWVLNADDDSIGAGNAGWAYWMGTENRIKAAGDGLAIKRVAFKNAAAAAHSWEIRKSTVVGTSPPALTTYTTIVQSGTFTSVANAWAEQVLSTPITLAENEWYIVWYWVGTGGQSFNFSNATPTQLDETFADLYAGVYRSAPGSAPGPASTTPQTRQTTTAYGFATLGIG